MTLADLAAWLGARPGARLTLLGRPGYYECHARNDLPSGSPDVDFAAYGAALEEAVRLALVGYDAEMIKRKERK